MTNRQSECARAGDRGMIFRREMVQGEEEGDNENDTSLWVRRVTLRGVVRKWLERES